MVDCDLVTNKLKLFTNKNHKWTSLISNQSFDLNKIYISELEHFIKCVKNQETSVNPISIGAEVLKTVFLIKKSAKEKRMISYNEI